MGCLWIDEFCSCLSSASAKRDCVDKTQNLYRRTGLYRLIILPQKVCYRIFPKLENLFIHITFAVIM